MGGHDVQRLTAVLQAAKEAGRPVLVHVHTVKGSGYDYALREPEKFHGVAASDPATGKVRQAGKETFSHVFGETLRQLAREDRRVCAITAAMADGTGLTDFAREFPQRFFDVGIAEGHGVATAGGMAKQGLIPVFAVYDSFLQRGYDMLVQDMALEKLHVVLAVQSLRHRGRRRRDTPRLSGLPEPDTGHDGARARQLCRAAADAAAGGAGDERPVAVRYPRGGEDGYDGDCGDESVTVLRQGTDAAIVTYGILTQQALRAAALLAGGGRFRPGGKS